MSKTTETDDGTTATNELLTVSEQHDLLASKRRRAVLDVLAAEQLPLELTDLASAVAMRDGEHEGDRHENERTRDRLVSMLHHADLPKLHVAGVIDYNDDCRRIEAYRPFQ